MRHDSFLSKPPPIWSAAVALAISVAAVWLSPLAAGAAPLPASSFAYRQGPVAVRKLGPAISVTGVTTTDITFPSPLGGQIRARLYVPAAGGRAGGGSRGGVLFVHWLGDDAKTTNLTEFADDAAQLARRGCTSLAIDAMWAQPDWFEKLRKPETDYEQSIRQVVELRRSLDVLLAQRGVDPARLAYVGHDFGAMYGAVLSGVDARPKYYVLMAGTTSFSTWYLLGSKPRDAATYVARMKPLDPLPYLRRSRARGYLFQFSANDRYVKRDEADAFFAAAPVPRGLFFYRSDHSLRDPLAPKDRLSWLSTRLGC